MKDPRINPANNSNELVEIAHDYELTEIKNELLKDSRVSFLFYGKRVAQIAAGTFGMMLLSSFCLPKVPLSITFSASLSLALSVAHTVNKMSKLEKETFACSTAFFGYNVALVAKKIVPGTVGMMLLSAFFFPQAPLLKTFSASLSLTLGVITLVIKFQTVYQNLGFLIHDIMEIDRIKQGDWSNFVPI